MVEKMQSTASNPINPEQQLAALAGMAAAGKGGGPVNAGGDAFLDGVMASVAGPIGSMFVGLADGIQGSNNSGAQSHHGQTSSLFLSPAPGKPGVRASSQQQQQQRVFSLMPEGGMSYSDKKRMMGMRASGSKVGRSQDIVAGARISSMSLTGSSLVGGRRSPIKGAKVKAPGKMTMDQMRKMGLLSREMCDEIDKAMRARDVGRYEGQAGQRRLALETSQGGIKAKNFNNSMNTGGSM